MIKEILAFSWAFFVAIFAIPSIIYVAHLKNLLDTPNLRKVHDTLTPRLGGLAIFGGFVSAIMIFGDLSFGVQHLIAGCIILFFIGLKDDMVTVSAFKKFFVQMLATGIIMYMGDIRITSFQGILGLHELDYGMSYAFTFVVVVGITNAFNLIDGLDGLAGSIIFITSATFGIFFYFFGGVAYGHYAIVAFSLMGGVLGFLRYNIRNAIIFMGDTGSLISGFILSVMAINFVEMRTIESAPAIAIGILFIPIMDTARVFAFRVLKGKSPFMPDKNHIHHLLIRTGTSQLGTVFILLVFNIAIIAFVVSFAYLGNLFLLISLIIIFAVFVAILELISHKHSKKITH